MEKLKYKKDIGSENFIFIVAFFGLFGFLASKMGLTNMLSTIMNTSYDLLINTVLYIMAVSVITGGLSSLFSEFGFIALINKFLSLIIKPIYDLPGASSLGILNCYLSDNPAILTLANEDNFKRYFKEYQLPALTNLGTSFGMGLIVTSTLMSMPIDNAINAALIGNLGAIIGSIISVRLMLIFTKKRYGTKNYVHVDSIKSMPKDSRVIREGNVFSRCIQSLLEGGKNGIEMGIAIIPGVLIICTLVFLLSNGKSTTGLYTGSAGEGVPVLPRIGNKLSFILNPLFGFSSSKSIAVPITAMGSAGAAIGIVKELAANKSINANDLAVFTAICMCRSGYLSTHIAMMDALKRKEMTGPAIFSHTIGGICAGIASHLLFMIL